MRIRDLNICHHYGLCKDKLCFTLDNDSVYEMGAKLNVTSPSVSPSVSPLGVIHFGNGITANDK